MRALQEFARSDAVEAFERRLESSLPADSVRGVHVDLDRYWLASWLAWMGARLADGPRSWPAEAWAGTARAVTPRMLSRLFGVEIELEYRPRDWPDYCRRRGYGGEADPILLRIILTSSGRHGFVPDADVVGDGHPVEYEVRPPARAAALELPSRRKMLTLLRPWERSVRPQSGDSVWGISQGTLGGFVRDVSSGRLCLVSCAHVLGGKDVGVFSPSTRDSWWPKRLGRVAQALIAPTVNAQPSVRLQFKLDAEEVRAVDVALAALDVESGVSGSQMPYGSVVRVGHVDDLHPLDAVAFRGRTSGFVNAQVGAHIKWHTIDVLGVLRRFDDIFELRPREHVYVSLGTSRGGDSGAWVVGPIGFGVGASWDGMVVGADGQSTYACYAMNTVDALGSLGLQTAVV